MTPALNEQVVASVNALGPTPFSAVAYRYTTAHREPLSGEGARRNGGRWNPKDLFPTIYLAIPESTCMGEVQRAAQTNHLSVERMLSVPYVFHTIAIQGLRVLDLRSVEALNRLGLEPEDLLSGDWSACQTVGHAAWFLDFAGVLAPSAMGQGLTLAVFEHKAEPDQVTFQSTVPLTPALFANLSSST